MKNKFSSLLKDWYEGNLSFDERMNEEKAPKEAKPEIKEEKIFIYKYKEMLESKGHYIYYEKNEERNCK